jgi:hypothetical protein
MHPPAPFPPPPPGASPAATAAALTRALSARGLTGIYTATAARFGLISVTAAVTAWTNGHQIWCTCAGQHHTGPPPTSRPPRRTLQPWPVPRPIGPQTHPGNCVGRRGWVQWRRRNGRRAGAAQVTGA